ncbi:MAG: ABC transporter ATP-binding protein [Candidatus Izimaplasma sp.]|nr:ABC transporter ATP-binding protein [Candidatus Izimaplasma bacterium]
MFVDIQSLSFDYDKHTKVLTEFSLLIKKGDIVALIGRSGSGKSTVLRLITGLETPIKGRITVNNKVFFDKHTNLPPEKRNVGMVFQDFALFPHMTVKKNVAYGLDHLSKQKKAARVNELLELVGLSHKEKNYPHQLSGGEKQRIALARALAPKPDMILLDEPFSNLDTELKDAIRDQLKAIIKQTGVTCIFVTHDLKDAKQIADKVINHT